MQIDPEFKALMPPLADGEKLYGVYSLGEFLLWMNENVSDPI
jgi:hypothetical protein